MLTVARVIKNKLSEEISTLDPLHLDDLEASREKRLQHMKKMAEKQSHWDLPWPQRQLNVFILRIENKRKIKKNLPNNAIR